jgi:hypothetical protein
MIFEKNLAESKKILVKFFIFNQKNFISNHNPNTFILQHYLQITSKMLSSKLISISKQNF